MNTSQPLVVVLSCKKNFEKQAILQKYFANKIDFIIVQGGSKETLLIDNILNLNVDDSYELLHLKIIEAYKLIYKKIKRPILKIDDDTFLNIRNFKNYTFNFDYGGFLNSGKTYDYTYHQNKVTDKRFKTPITDSYDYNFALGGGYFLSKKALKIFINNYNKASEASNHLEFKKGREDRLIGQVLHPFIDKINIKNDGYWIERDTASFSAFKDTIFHPIDLQKFNTLISKRNTKFYV
jgi:hypothetical protein